MSIVRNHWLLLSLPLLVACGKVVHEPNELTAGGAAESFAGRRASDPAEGAGTNVDSSRAGSGGSSPTVTPESDGGMARADAGTPPKPAADGGTKDAGTAREPLCDGSADMRLVFVVGGGFVDSTYFFTNPHGHAFFAVDGKCRFFAGQNYMRGILTGTLSPAQADQLSADVHWDALAGWGDWGTAKDFGCPDAGGLTLIRAKVAASCTCGCDDKAPQGLGDALGKAYEWVEKLTSSGTPVDGPVTAIILSDRSVGGPVNQPKFDWPLSRPSASIPGLVLESGNSGFLMGDVGVRFDDAADYAKLREMRSATTMTDVPNSGSIAGSVIVRENGNEYNLFVRDELPDDADKAWKTLDATVPLPPNR
jgi:hypothetical protein